MADKNKSLDQSDENLTLNIWRLEDSYPDVTDLLTSARIENAADDGVIVVLDTNVLLLPFKVGGEELDAIEKVYEKLIAKRRLFIPDRTIREYIKNRDSILADIQKGTRDKGSTVSSGSVEIAPFLKRLPETDAVDKAFIELKAAQKKYLKAVDGLVKRILDWRGDDPVTQIYNRLFVGEVVFKLEKSRADIEKDWSERSRNKVPPGYKDSTKADTGIGDFLVWLAILELGQKHKKNMIFVTGDEKADWCVRSNHVGLYPRPELIAEYRKASEGGKFKIARLADLLSDMEVSEELVQDVRKADVPASTPAAAKGISLMRNLTRVRSANFDYSTHNGSIVLSDSDGVTFELRFSKASDRAIYLYRTNTSTSIARAKNTVVGELVQFENYDNTSRTYAIKLGELFFVEHSSGKIFVGRITGIQDDSRGAEQDSVSFDYSIFNAGETIVAP